MTVVAHKTGDFFRNEVRFTAEQWKSAEWRGFKRRYLRTRTEYVVRTDSGEVLTFDSHTLVQTGSHPARRLRGRKKYMVPGVRIKMFKHPKDGPSRWRFKFVGE